MTAISDGLPLDSEEEPEEEEPEKEEEAPPKQALKLPLTVSFARGDCSAAWAKKGASLFCKLGLGVNKGLWVEAEEGSGKVLFGFDVELYHAEESGEVGLLDSSRLMVIVLLRSVALIAGVEDARDALQAALDADNVFLEVSFYC
jgi:hypothetical protein